MLSQIRHQLLQAKSPWASVCMVAFIVTLAATGILMSDMYAPSLPAIAHTFHVSADVVRLSISLFLFGVTAPQLLFGPLSDAWGRKKIILPGLLLAVIGSAVCLWSINMWMLSLGRFIQGVGVGAISLNARVISRDVFSNQQLVKVFAYIGTAISIAPAIAPLIGGYVQYYFDWRMIFVVMMSLLIVISILVMAFLPETNRHVGKNPLELKTALSNYKRLLKTPSFTANVFYSACSFAIIMVYFTVSPHLLQVDLGLSVVHYSWSCAFVVLMMVLSRLVNVFLTSYFLVSNIIRSGVLLMLVSASSLVILSLAGMFSIASLLAPVAVMMLGIGLVFGNVMAQAFKDVGLIAGSAGALFGTTQVFFAATCSAIASHLPATNMTSFSFFCLFLVLCLVVLSVRQFAYDRVRSNKS